MESVGGILCAVTTYIPTFHRKTCDGCNHSYDRSYTRRSQKCCYPMSEEEHHYIFRPQLLFIATCAVRYLFNSITDTIQSPLSGLRSRVFGGG
jgi:hypothetical protein